MRRVQSVQNAASRLFTGARSHLAGATSPALASGPEADQLQAGVPTALFICHWLDKLLITSPRIFTLLLQVQVASSVPLRTGRAVSHARTVRPATEALPQQGLVCGTVCHRIYATKTQFSELQAPAENSLVYC